MGRFNELIGASVRRTTARVRFSLATPEIKEGAVVEASDGAVFSRREQVIDNIEEMTARIATFEPDHWRLDGSFILPVEAERSSIQAGFWSDEMSGGDGVFGYPPFIEVVLGSIMNIPVFGVMFDELTKDWAEDFVITAFDGAGNVIYRRVVEGHDGAYFSTDEGVQGVYRIRYEFMRTNKPHRRLRVVELNFGVVVAFDGEDIMELSLITEGDTMGKVLALSSFNLTVANKGRFNQMDADSLAHYLYKRQAFEYRHGVIEEGEVVEWVNCGVYYLNGWSVTDDVVKFNAQGRASVLDNIMFLRSTYEKMSVGDVMREVVEGIGFNVYIPAFLFSAPFVMGYFGELSYRRVLGYLAEMSCCMVHEDKQNRIIFTDILEEREHTGVVDYDNSFGAPKVAFGTYYNGINLVVKRAVESGMGMSDVEFIREEKFYDAPWKDPKEVPLPFSVDLPMMIDDGSDEFEEFVFWFLARKFGVLRQRLTCNVTWRQNPLHEVGDRILMQVNRQNARVPMFATIQNIEFKGGVLRGKTKGVGFDEQMRNAE